jgi:spore coat protein U domain-containing protein, fimbrial subunit CupE1/2/3/6
MRRILILVAGLAALPILHATLDAQSATASMTVSATVAKNCTITTTPVNFGAYDPVAANATTPLNGTGTLTVACTKGTVAKVGLNAGANAQGALRRMSQSATAYLNYEIYSDAAHTIIWGNTASDGVDIPAAPSKVPRNFTAYGQVASAQDATVGSYTDTVVATVNF